MATKKITTERKNRDRLSLEEVVQLARRIKQWGRDGLSNYIYHGIIEDVVSIFLQNDELIGYSAQVYSHPHFHIIGHYSDRSEVLHEMYSLAQRNYDEAPKTSVKTNSFGKKERARIRFSVAAARALLSSPNKK